MFQARTFQVFLHSNELLGICPEKYFLVLCSIQADPPLSMNMLSLSFLSFLFCVSIFVA